MTEPYVKDPYDKEDFGVNYYDWIGSDTISVSTWTVSPTGPTLSADAINNTTKVTTTFVEGGTHGVDYTLTNSITTATGLKKRRSILIQVKSQ